MEKQITIVRTKQGEKYALEIKKKIESLGVDSSIVCWTELDDFIRNNHLNPSNTVLHYRSTGETKVTPKAFDLQNQGFHLINKAEVLDRTGNKFNSYQWAKDAGIDLPKTWLVEKESANHHLTKNDLGEVVIKPVNSVGGGVYCYKTKMGDPELNQKILNVPGDKIIIQELVNYTKIYRVIVIAEKALRGAVFVDEPTANDWKVSVCLNPNMLHVKEPDQNLLEYAETLAKVFESEIAFVDVYETKDGYVLSEINTACSLGLHEKLSGHDISGEIAKYLVSQI